MLTMQNKQPKPRKKQRWQEQKGRTASEESDQEE
jgi:hypothetical protein